MELKDRYTAHKNMFSASNFLKDFIFKTEREKYEDVVVTGLKLVQQELQTLVDFTIVADHLYDGVYIADGQGKVLYVNKAYVRITGITMEEVIGKHVIDLAAKELYKNGVVLDVISQKKRVNSMVECSRTRKKILSTGNPIFDAQGNVTNVVVVIRDITELVAMKDEVESSHKQMQEVIKEKNKNNLLLEHLKSQQLNESLIGESVQIREVTKLIERVANLDVTVLITGETGSGKEVIANEIYKRSSRNKAPFIKVNCAAIPSNLLEAELFGYEKGAFTGATNVGKIGMFELADKGVLLLDEIGEMPMELQPKLLRVIQHKQLTRIGGTKPISLDVRIIAATNASLPDLVKQRKFREDIYYRLNVLPIDLPPLRSRVRDIEVLANHFLKLYNLKYGKFIIIDEQGMQKLKQYEWPGNVRELQNVIERLIIISEPETYESDEKIDVLLGRNPHCAEIAQKEIGLREMLDILEKKELQRALEFGGSTRKAAKILKIDQSTVVRKAKKYGICINDAEVHQ